MDSIYSNNSNEDQSGDFYNDLNDLYQADEGLNSFNYSKKRKFSDSIRGIQKKYIDIT